MALHSKPLIPVPLEKIPRLNFISNDTLKKGQKEMKKHKIVFMGIARNNMYPITKVIQYIEYTSYFFDDYRVIVFENDSEDKTKDILAKWALDNSKVKIITKDFYNKKRLNIKFLATARNFYLNEYLTQKYKDFDMAFIVDFDMAYGWDVRGVAHSFSQIDKWDVVASNGISNTKGDMYDLFAFRSDNFKGLCDFKKSKDYWKYVAKKTTKQFYSPTRSLIPVYSAFGGMAIYKRKFLLGCEYDSFNNDCEHVMLHKCIIKNGGRIFLNPAQMIRYIHWKE